MRNLKERKRDGIKLSTIMKMNLWFRLRKEAAWLLVSLLYYTLPDITFREVEVCISLPTGCLFY